MNAKLIANTACKKAKRKHNNTDYIKLFIQPFSLIPTLLMFSLMTVLITLWSVLSISFLYGIYSSSTAIEAGLNFLNFSLAFFALGHIVQLHVSDFIKTMSE